MIVLGIANNDEASACLVRDRRIVAAVSEERLSRIKGHRGWPALAIAHVLQAGDLALEQVDCIAYGWHAGFDADKHLLLYFDRIVEESRRRPAAIAALRQRVADELQNDRHSRLQFDAFLAEHGLAHKALYLDHHECHALGAYVCAPFVSALCVSCDGRGDFQSLTVSRYSPGHCTVLQRETSIDSLGFFYGRITRLLGFQPNRHEGKVTGLAAAGDPQKLLPLMRQMIGIEGTRLRAHCGAYFLPSYAGYSEELKTLLAKEKPEDIAAAAQRHLEDLLLAIVRPHLCHAGAEPLCLAGGVFANVKLNQRLREMDGVSNVYVLPCMGDGGLSLAAAVGANYLQTGVRIPRPSMALGPEAGDCARLLDVLAHAYPGLGHCQPADMIAVLTDALAHDQVLGICKGRAEFGPRALCNRSILYHAADRSAHDGLNARLQRSEFMPFAPITAVEFAADCYVGWQDEHVAADYMTMTYACHPRLQEVCPAVVHVDGTARPQIVRPEADPFIHRLLHAWQQATGQPALINTSFNRHETPIICDAREAFDALNAGMVDLVVLNETLLVWDRSNRFASKRFDSCVD